MAATHQTLLGATIRGLNRIFWLASIGLWVWIVFRSEIWSAGLMTSLFWINFLIFLAAGLGVLATTHFAASALPLLLGVMALTAHGVKAGWFWLNVYVVAAAVIGFFAAIARLAALNNRLPEPIDKQS
jgi:hypothetical protein